MNARLIPATLFIAVAAAFAVPSFAQTTSLTPTQNNVQKDTQRDVNQQQRIENGLQSGQLSTREAGKLEKGEANTDRMEKNADRNGNVSPREQARITRAQNRESAAIARDKTNAQTGNPNSLSSQRLQADVQRNVNQEKRIEGGKKSGALTTREAGALEKGQAKVDRTEARAAANGHVSGHEQARIQAREDHQSNRIHALKHNGRTAA